MWTPRSAPAGPRSCGGEGTQQGCEAGQAGRPTSASTTPLKQPLPAPERRHLSQPMLRSAVPTRSMSSCASSSCPPWAWASRGPAARRQAREGRWMRGPGLAPAHCSRPAALQRQPQPLTLVDRRVHASALLLAALLLLAAVEGGAGSILQRRQPGGRAVGWVGGGDGAAKSRRVHSVVSARHRGVCSLQQDYRGLNHRSGPIFERSLAPWRRAPDARCGALMLRSGDRTREGRSPGAVQESECSGLPWSRAAWCEWGGGGV